MSYTVLARKFRSQTFDEVVGQSAVVTTLRNAIEQQRVHHGYLFTGTRGVGKTSMARILAKCLNCLAVEQPTLQPCGQCDSCVGIARGEDIDVIEIDAASNTGVDDIRELRNNAVFRPARARFKIYIIDEVHMLSTNAFNALLKTLEEPPEHVKFIFATTEVQKLLPTILSRVQRFDFKSISPADIATQIKSICAREGFEAQEDAVRRIARLANGSMRDALSLLDQALSMGGRRLTAEILDELFPTTHDDQLSALIDCLAKGDAAGGLTLVDATLGQGHTLDYWCTRLISQLRDLMLLRVCGGETDLVDAPTSQRPRLVEQARCFDPGALVYMITVLEEVRRSVKSGVSGRALVEAVVIRLAEASRFSSIETLLDFVGGADSSAEVGSSKPAANSAATAMPAARPSPTPQSPPAMRAEAKPQSAPPRPTRAPRTEAVETAPAASGRVTQADLKAAHAEPAVKAALEVFGGRIVDVQRGAGGPAPTTGASS